jgi:hypothetical protein
LENTDIGSAVQDALENTRYVEAEISGGELVTWAVAAEGTSRRATSGWHQIPSWQRAAAQASRWEKIVARDATRGRLPERRPH